MHLAYQQFALFDFRRQMTKDIQVGLRINQEAICKMLGGIQDLVLPPQCPISGDRVGQHGFLSPESWKDLSFVEAPFCEKCGVPFQIESREGTLCAPCAAPDGFEQSLTSDGYLDKIRTTLRYDDISSQLILALKYGDRLDLVPAMARLMMTSMSEFESFEEPMLVPVPLHPSRLRDRRFNQAALLADALGQLCKLETVVDLLQRTRATPQQQGLSAKARQRNVRGAFRVRQQWRGSISGRSMLLIDDVLTTGSTLLACARTLKRAGASQVSALVLTRVVQDEVIAI